MAKDEVVTENGERVVYRDKPKKPFYKRVWFWVLAVIVLIVIVSSSSAKNDTQTNTDESVTPATTENKEPAKFDLATAYDKVVPGMTKAEVEAATGVESKSCSTIEDPTLGKSETCTYGNMFTDGGSMSVTYGNDGKSTTKFKYEN